jgi:hypothetical protein
LSVVDADVRKIIDVSASEVSDLTPFIEAAEAVVSAQTSGLGATLEDRVTTWLAAHFLAIRTPRSKSEGAGSVRAAFFGAVDLGLNVTRYGQMAMTLDSSGGLAQWNRAVNEGRGSGITFEWLGTEDDTSWRS